MIPELRRRFNEEQFSEAKHRAMVDWIAEQYGHRPPFPIAETPVFVPRDLHEHLLRACDDIIDVITAPDFHERSAGAIPAGQLVPNEHPIPHFLQLDFGIVLDESDRPFPQLIEAQGFPSLYFFQDILAQGYRRTYDIPADLHALFGGLTPEGYRQLLADIILDGHKPENVILLEVEPERQNTRIDFIVAEHALGIPTVCISKLHREGRQLFYERDGRRIPVKRIFNRVIFDELLQRDDLPRQFNLTEDADVTWAGHPNWFFRISKHTLPLLRSPYVPESVFLSDLHGVPTELDRYVLKPLYSFAGSGVKINVQEDDLMGIGHPDNYILQRKVEYAPVIQTPDGGAKAEIRMMFLWRDGEARPRLVNNLIRLSKGEMVGVRFNKNKTWVGGSVGFFEAL